MKNIASFVWISQLLVFVLTLPTVSAFVPPLHHTTTPSSIRSNLIATTQQPASTLIFKMADNPDNTHATTSSSEEEEEGEEEVTPPPSLENSVIPPPTQPQPKRLDPLVQSLTRMDAETAQAKTIQVPVWGELILDKSLYVLLPVAAFAVLGFLFSIYIAATVSDDWVLPTSSSVLPPTDTIAPASSSAVIDSGCRGLCSSPTDQDLEGLRNFMKGLTK